MATRLFYRLSQTSQLFTLRTCAYLFALSLAVGCLGYWFLEDYTFMEALYMTVITVSTVGFGEVRPLSPSGQLFTSFYLLANLGITALFITQLTQHLRTGGIFAQLRRYLMKKEIAQLDNHVIVCGGGRYGREILAHFSSTSDDVVVVESDKNVLAEITESYPELFTVEGDATSADTLHAAGILRAKALIATLGDDSDNAFLVLSARELAPQIKIVARVYRSENNSKLLKVGADYVVQPEQIGSFFMATMVRKPSAIEFFRSIVSGAGAEVGFEEINFDSLPKGLKGGSLLDMNLRRRTGVSVVALRYPDGHYEVNPDPESKVEEGVSLIALGDHDQLEKLKQLVDHRVG